MYKNPKVTVDALVKKGKQLLLIQRKKEPFKGQWAFPGGHVDFSEDPKKAVLRELKEETNLQGSEIDLFNVYGEPNRDPRGHYITIVYRVHVMEDQFQYLKADDDAKDAKFHDIQYLLDNKNFLAFDHHKILTDYFKDKDF